MSLTKKEISYDISSKADIKKKDANKFLDSFISVVLKNSKKKKVKLSNFGSFYYKKTPQRIGRNPKTGIEYTIYERSNLVFKSSAKIKKIFN